MRTSGGAHNFFKLFVSIYNCLLFFTECNKLAPPPPPRPPGTIRLTVDAPLLAAERALVFKVVGIRQHSRLCSS